MVQFRCSREVRLLDQPTLKKLYLMSREGILTDMTIMCGRKVFLIHKLILCVSSTYYAILNKKTNDTKVVQKSETILINDVEPSDIENLITYMYLGEVMFPEEKLAGFIRVANYFHIDGVRSENAVNIPHVVTIPSPSTHNMVMRIRNSMSSEPPPQIKNINMKRMTPNKPVLETPQFKDNIGRNTATDNNFRVPLVSQANNKKLKSKRVSKRSSIRITPEKQTRGSVQTNSRRSPRKSQFHPSMSSTHIGNVKDCLNSDDKKDNGYALRSGISKLSGELGTVSAGRIQKIKKKEPTQAMILAINGHVLIAECAVQKKEDSVMEFPKMDPRNRTEPKMTNALFQSRTDEHCRSQYTSEIRIQKNVVSTRRIPTNFQSKQGCTTQHQNTLTTIHSTHKFRPKFSSTLLTSGSLVQSKLIHIIPTLKMSKDVKAVQVLENPVVVVEDIPPAVTSRYYLRPRKLKPNLDSSSMLEKIKQRDNKNKVLMKSSKGYEYTGNKRGGPRKNQ